MSFLIGDLKIHICIKDTGEFKGKALECSTKVHRNTEVCQSLSFWRSSERFSSTVSLWFSVLGNMPALNNCGNSGVDNRCI